MRKKNECWPQPCLLRKPCWKSGRRLLLSVSSSSPLTTDLSVTLLGEWRTLIEQWLEESWEGMTAFGMQMTVARFHQSGKYCSLIIALIILQRYAIKFFRKISRNSLPMSTVPSILLSFNELTTEETSSGVAWETFEWGATKVETWVEMRWGCWLKSGRDLFSEHCAWSESARIFAFWGPVVRRLTNGRRERACNFWLRRDLTTFQADQE